ncbi:MAG TPA: hypothetical protein VIU61_08425 [Kofleriaceae bacterium]
MRLLLVLMLWGCSAPPAVVSTPPQAAVASVPWRSCLLDGASPCVSTAPIRVATELIAWSDWLGDHPGVECRWVAELDHVLLCGSAAIGPINTALVRASIFVEMQPRVVVERTDPMYLAAMKLIAGHDLMKRHREGRPDLLQFYAALDRACAATQSVCADPSEQAMRRLLETTWAQHTDLVVLTFARHGPIADDETVSHEILHAQYFTDPKFREVITDYWWLLPEEDRAAIRRTLAGTYSTKDHELMQNEMQAYALMSGGERTRFRALLAHRDALLRRLAERGLRPIAVQQRD